MSIELKVPEVGESITEVQIGEWLKGAGDFVKKEESVVVIETDKVTVELPAPVAGTISKVLVQSGQKAAVGDVLGYMEEGAEPQRTERKAKPQPAAQPARERAAAPEKTKEPEQPKAPEKTPRSPHVMPAARRALAERGLEAEQVEASGPGGRMLVEDVERTAREGAKPRQVEPAADGTAPSSADGRGEEVVPMTPLRRRIAERLVAAQNNAAILTTFNEIDMQAVQDLRAQFQQRFQDVHGIKLGLMSFFVKAAIEALRKIPAVNAEIRGGDIAYRNYYDIGVAIGGGKGLLVPVLRNAERMSFADIERTIADFARRAGANQLALEELQGGTFTISNGGVYGSLLSTPILNPPQSGILGLHAIQERAVVRQGQVVVRPMMYVALSYDHRLIDGRESVTFLKHIVECIEAPARILLEL